MKRWAPGEMLPKGPAGERATGEGATPVLGASPCRDLAVVHVGRNDDPELALASLRDRETGMRVGGLQADLEPPGTREPEVLAHLAV